MQKQVIGEVILSEDKKQTKGVIPRADEQGNMRKGKG